MKKTLHIIIIVICIIFTSCTPPRNGNYKKKDLSSNKLNAKKNNPEKENTLSGNSDVSKTLLDEKIKAENDSLNFAKKKHINNRETDTNYIYLDTINISKNNLFENKNINLDREFDKAVVEFDKEKFTDACSKFDIFNSTLNMNDSLYYESAFYKSECLITNNRLQEAENILLYLSKNEIINKNTLERVILRLGQVYCAQGKKGLAEKYFNSFKKEFSNSIFYKLATCDVVK
jgi:hypothetical protein